MNLKLRDLTLKNNVARYLLVVISIIAVFTLKWFAVPAIFIVYVILSLAFKNRIT
jgi:CDP-diacylglycerol--serine O-phosphatidyltransferase